MVYNLAAAKPSPQEGNLAFIPADGKRIRLSGANRLPAYRDITEITGSFMPSSHEYPVDKGLASLILSNIVLLLKENYRVINVLPGCSHI